MQVDGCDVVSSIYDVNNFSRSSDIALFICILGIVAYSL